MSCARLFGVLLVGMHLVCGEAAAQAPGFAFVYAQSGIKLTVTRGAHKIMRDAGYAFERHGKTMQLCYRGQACSGIRLDSLSSYTAVEIDVRDYFDGTTHGVIFCRRFTLRDGGAENIYQLFSGTIPLQPLREQLPAHHKLVRGHCPSYV